MDLLCYQDTDHPCHSHYKLNRLYYFPIILFFFFSDMKRWDHVPSLSTLWSFWNLLLSKERPSAKYKSLPLSTSGVWVYLLIFRLFPVLYFWRLMKYKDILWLPFVREWFLIRKPFFHPVAHVHVTFILSGRAMSIYLRRPCSGIIFMQSQLM